MNLQSILVLIAVAVVQVFQIVCHILAVGFFFALRQGKKKSKCGCCGDCKTCKNRHSCH